MTPCTPMKKACIWHMAKNDVKIPDITAKLGLHCTTVSRNLKALKENPDFYQKPICTGRPQKLNEHDLRLAQRAITSGKRFDAIAVQQNLFATKISACTMWRYFLRMGLHGHIRRMKPYLSMKHKWDRRKWARKHAKWIEEKWKKVWFSDEFKFNLFGSDGRLYCRRAVGEEFLDRNVRKELKHGGGSMMIWGYLT